MQQHRYLHRTGTPQPYSLPDGTAHLASGGAGSPGSIRVAGTSGYPGSGPLDRAVLSICEIAGSSAFTIIPEAVSLIGTVRTFDMELRARISRRIEEIAAGVAAAGGANAAVRIEAGPPPVVNAQDMCGIVIWTTRRAERLSRKPPLVQLQPALVEHHFAGTPVCGGILRGVEGKIPTLSNLAEAFIAPGGQPPLEGACERR